MGSLYFFQNGKNPAGKIWHRSQLLPRVFPNRRKNIRYNERRELLYSSILVQILSFFFCRERAVVSNIIYVERRSYGFWKFVGDCIMTIITCGFWLIWVFIREMRKR